MELLREIHSILKDSDIDYPQKEAELLLTESALIDRVALYRDNPEIPKEMESIVRKSAKRRSLREPLQYILGYADFYGLRFKVGMGVLIPRPETELLAKESIDMASGLKGDIFIADICTGSGCLAITIAKHIPQAIIYGVDTSKDALSYAEKNRQMHRTENVRFLMGDLYEPLSDMRFDIIVSNPPYIKSDIIKDLEPEVRDWEPREALDGGKDGLMYYKKILSGAKGHLKKDGSVILELGEGTKEGVIKEAERAGLYPYFLKKDYAGIDRVLCLKVGNE